MILTLLAIVFAHTNQTARDAARLDGDRLVVTPVGVSFRVPDLWLGRPAAPGRDINCAPEGTVADRIVTEPTRFWSLLAPNREWTKEFAAVVDSVLPPGALTAHLGGAPWNGNCGTLQMRVYVGEDLARLTLEAVPGLRSASRFFNPVTRARNNSAGWHITRLAWDAWYYDTGGPAVVEFWSRRVRGRDVVLVFMFVGYSPDQPRDRVDIIRSFREQPPDSVRRPASHE